MWSCVQARAIAEVCTQLIKQQEHNFLLSFGPTEIDVISSLLVPTYKMERLSIVGAGGKSIRSQMPTQTESMSMFVNHELVRHVAVDAKALIDTIVCGKQA